MLMKVPNNGGFYGDSQIDYDEEDLEARMNEIETIMDEDFSEYLWMENEEEFDKIEMQRLEEEALMQQCVEDMLNDVNDEYNSDDNDVNEEASTTKIFYFIAAEDNFADYPSDYVDDQEDQADTRDKDHNNENKKILKYFSNPSSDFITLDDSLASSEFVVDMISTTESSNLNPLAAEFIPSKLVI